MSQPLLDRILILSRRLHFDLDQRRLQNVDAETCDHEQVILTGL